MNLYCVTVYVDGDRVLIGENMTRSEAEELVRVWSREVPQYTYGIWFTGYRLTTAEVLNR